jgi:hypothetical protein
MTISDLDKRLLNNFSKSQPALQRPNYPTEDNRVLLGDIIDSLTVCPCGSGTSNTFWVDNNRTDPYTPDGSVDKPFLTIQDAIDVTTGIRNTIKILSGVYTENLTINNDNYLFLDLDGSCIVGNIIWNISAAAALYKPKLMIRGNELRSYYPLSAGYNLTGVVGNITINQYVITSTYVGLHLVNTGVVGNINFTGVSGGILTHLFVIGGGYTGDITTDSNIVVALYAYDSLSSSSASIGGAVGTIVPKILVNVELTRIWNIGNIGGAGGGIWYNARFKTGSRFDNTAPMTGNYSVDSNSYASYFANVAPKGSETFTLLDKASGIQNDSSVSGTTVKDALNNCVVKNGINGSFTTVDGKTITIANGQVTSIV